MTAEHTHSSRVGPTLRLPSARGLPGPCSHGSAQDGSKRQKSEASTEVHTATDRPPWGPRPGLDSKSWASFQKPRGGTARPEGFSLSPCDIYLELAGPEMAGFKSTRNHD